MIISKIAVALDATVPAINFAADNKCNVLITHHPAFLEAPDKIIDGTNVYEAARNKIALMNFHTALDVHVKGSSLLPKLLNLKMGNVLCPTDGKSQKKSEYGFGRVCQPKGVHRNSTLLELSKMCAEVFGRKPRVWGNSNQKLNNIVTTTGSAGKLSDPEGVLQAVIDNNIDCIVCGEIGYHDALELKNLGISVIELGHDVSELPLTDAIICELVNIGIRKNDIIQIEQDDNWI